MNSVYSEQWDVTITGNTVTRHNQDKIDIARLLGEYNQLTIVQTENDLWDVSSVMDEQDHWTFAAAIHRLNSENKLNKKVDTKGPNPDNDGPKPTNPRGSGGTVVEYENTKAIAA